MLGRRSGVGNEIWLRKSKILENEFFVSSVDDIPISISFSRSSLSFGSMIYLQF